MNNRWTFYAWLLIGVLLALLILRAPLLPNFLDIYYHLAVAQGFDKAGGFVTHAFWEYAPGGRPNLYPPLFHFLLLGLIKTGLPLITIARLVDIVIFPLFLTVIWFISRSLFGARVGFLSIVLGSSIYSFYLCSSNFAPFTLAFIFGLLSFWALERGRLRLAIMMLGMAFYTHVQVPWIFLAALLFYGFLVRPRLLPVFKLIGGAIFLALPFLLYLLAHVGSYHPQAVYERFTFEFALSLVLAGFGVRRACRDRGPALFFVALAVTLLIAAFSYPYRYMCGQGLVAIILLAALGWDDLWHVFSQRQPSGKWLLMGIFAGVVCAPSIVLLPKMQPQFIPVNASFQELVRAEPAVERSNAHCVYSRSMDEIVAIIRQKSGPNDILFSNWPFTATIIAVMADRANSEGMLQEIGPRQDEDVIRYAHYANWFKQEGAEYPERDLMERYHLKKSTETPMASIYENTAAQVQMNVAHATIPAGWVLFFGCILVALIIL